MKYYVVTHPVKNAKEVKETAIKNKLIIIDKRHIDKIDKNDIAFVDGKEWKDGKPKRKQRLIKSENSSESQE